MQEKMHLRTGLRISDLAYKKKFAAVVLLQRVAL